MNLKNFFYQFFFEQKKIQASLRPQTFDVEFFVAVKNVSPKKISGSLLMPVPQKTKGQKMISEITFSQDVKMRYDINYKNTYGVLDLKIDYDSEKYLFANCTVAIHPRAFDRLTEIKRKNIFLKANQYVHVVDKRLQEISSDIIDVKDSVEGKAKSIYSYVVKNLRYGKPIEGLYSSQDALDKDYVDCGGFDTLFVSLCRFHKIPARVVSGFWLGYKKNTMHAWAEFLNSNNEWVPVDPSVEQLRKDNRTKKIGGFHSIGSDRMILSFGEEIPISIKEKHFFIPIVQHPHFFDSNGVSNKVELDFQVKTKKYD